MIENLGLTRNPNISIHFIYFGHSMDPSFGPKSLETDQNSYPNPIPTSNLARVPPDKKTPNFKIICRQTRPRNIKRILCMIMCNLNYIMRQSPTTSSRPSLKENLLQITKHRPSWAKLRMNSLRIIASNLKLTISTNNGKKYREMKGLKSCSNHGMTRFCKEISKEHKMK